MGTIQHFLERSITIRLDTELACADEGGSNIRAFKEIEIF